MAIVGLCHKLPMLHTHSVRREEDVVEMIAIDLSLRHRSVTYARTILSIYWL